MLHGNPALSPLIVLVLAIVVFGIVTPTFLRPEALSLLVQQMAVVGALAVGQTLIILTAGVDLSIGAGDGADLAGDGRSSTSQGVPGFIALLIGLAVAVLTGLLNGVLVTRINLPPFIVTLGTFSIFTAASLLYAQGQTISLPANAFLLTTGGTLSIGSVSVTWGVILMLLLYAVVGSPCG